MQVIHICCRDKFDQTIVIQSSNGHVCRAWLQRFLQFQVVTDSFTLQLPGPNASRTSMKLKDGQTNPMISMAYRISTYPKRRNQAITNILQDTTKWKISKCFQNVWQSHEIQHCHFSSTMSCKQASTVVWQACCCADALQRFGFSYIHSRSP